MGTAELESIKRVFDSGILTEGRVCAELERQFAKYVGCRYAVATSSCTSALHLALIALGVGRGDEVIVPDFTFPATANAVRMTGASPVLVDIDLRSYNIDPAQISAVISSRTRAIMLAHLFGLSADMAPILRVARRHGIKVIEDAACAVGTTYSGHKAGTLGDVACFSFHPRKVITTGEGGMITTNNKRIAELTARVKNHGALRVDGRLRFLSMGYNYRLSDVHAAIGLVQLKKVDRLIRSRIRIAKLYTDLLGSVEGIVTPYSRNGDVHTYQSYVVRLTEGFGRKRDNMIRALRGKGIQTQIGTYALHMQQTFRDLAIRRRYPNSRVAYDTSLSLPISSIMKRSQVERVVGSIRQLKVT